MELENRAVELVGILNECCKFLFVNLFVESFDKAEKVIKDCTPNLNEFKELVNALDSESELYQAQKENLKRFEFLFETSKQILAKHRQSESES